MKYLKKKRDGKKWNFLENLRGKRSGGVRKKVRSKKWVGVRKYVGE